jgi:transposase
MWKPFRLSIEENVPGCAIVYDKFHVLQDANRAIDEVRRAEFFRQGGQMRDLVKGKRWLLLSRWESLGKENKQSLQALLEINEKLLKAYLLKESLDQLWLYRYEGAMLNFLQG